MVTTTFSTPDPPLLTPLLTNAARAQALRAYGGHCLNCNGTDHSMKSCTQAFLNTSGILNPALGQLNDGGHAYRQWQQRMRSYRREQYETHRSQLHPLPPRQQQRHQPPPPPPRQQRALQQRAPPPWPFVRRRSPPIAGTTAAHRGYCSHPGACNPNYRLNGCLLYTSPSPRDLSTSRMPSSA